MKTLQRYYNRKSIYKYNNEENSLHNKVIGLIDNKSCVLDVGCADGYIGKILSKKKNTVYGVELSNQLAIIAKKHLFKVVKGNVEEIKLPFKDSFFDYILLLDVLEHLFNPCGALLKLKKHLKKDGKAIITLPNVANWKVRLDLLQGKFIYTDSGIMDEGHIRFYTLDTAQALVEKAGFKIKTIDNVVTMPSFLWKLDYRLPFLNIQKHAKTTFKKLFTYQYIFVVLKI